MAKPKTSGNGRRTEPAAKRNPSGTRVMRDAATGTFLVGRSTFSRISAVEGIRASKALKSDLRALDGAPRKERRAVLAAKYGKRT